MESKQKKTNNILKQGTILAAASVIVRMIGLLYRVPLNNLLTDDGVGIYQVAYQIYQVALIVSSYGLPLAVSKMVAAKNVKGEYKNSQKIFKNALIFAAVIGGVVGGIIYFGADFFADMWEMKGVALPLRVLAPTIFCVAVLGVLRGFFQGQNTMVPTAISQVFEQIVNAIVSFVAAYLLMEMHSTSQNKYAYGAAGSTTGTLSGALAALLVMIGVYMINRPVFHRQRRRDRHPVDSDWDIYRMLFVTVIPVILSQTVYQISSVIDSLMFGKIMAGHHVSESVRSGLIGVYGGQYTLLLSVPLGIATAMGTSIIPSVVASFNSEDSNGVKEKIRTVVKFNMLLAIPCAVGLSVLGTQVVYMLFPNLVTYRHVAGMMLLTGSIALIFYALSTVTSGVLQAVNQMKLPMIHSAISLAIHVVLVFVLLQYTNLGVYALIIGNITFPLVVCVLNWRSVGKCLDYHQEIRTTFTLPTVAALIMGVVCFVSYQGLHLVIEHMGKLVDLGGKGAYFNNAISTLVAVILGVVIYFLVALLLKTVKEEELMEMPMGRTLWSVAKKLHLL